MKHSLIHIATIALSAAAFTACDNEFERPPMVLPTATWTPNTTVEQFKADYWSTVEGTPVTVGLTESGDSVIFKARVCSSDETGNIFKYLFVQGETESLALSLDFYDIYKSYKYGQEVLINATGLTIGGYSGLMILGYGTDDRGRVARCPEATFKPQAQTNGLPNTALVDTTVVTIPTIETAKSSAQGLELWQSRLIRIENVSFEDAGKPFAEGTGSINRYITDEQGNRITVYNSTYSDFKDQLLPAGQGSVTGILSYFGTNWQILLIDAAGCSGFDGLLPPSFSLPAGNVEKGTEVTLTPNSDGSEIHYTTDGSTPTAESPLYSGPIVINSTTEIKAIAIKDGKLSAVVSARYVVTAPVVFTETFEGGNLGQFTNTVVAATSWTGWRANTSTPLCALANSYVGGTNEAAEAWLVSPQINLSDRATAHLSVEQAFGYYFPTTQEQFCTLNIREVNGTWTALTLTNFPPQGSGNWTGWAANDIDISAYAGKTVEIGFKYLNDGNQSIAWEIKNLTISGDPK